MPPQQYDWTCSACSLEWVKRSTGLIMPSDIYASRQETVYEIGYPHNINSTYGLMDAQGRAIQDVYDRYGQATAQDWLSFDDVCTLAEYTTAQMSGTNWYHWVALRGMQGNSLWIANSAPGYKGIFDTLSREDFDRLGGFSVVWLV